MPCHSGKSFSSHKDMGRFGRRGRHRGRRRGYIYKGVWDPIKLAFVNKSKYKNPYVNKIVPKYLKLNSFKRRGRRRRH